MKIVFLISLFFVLSCTQENQKEPPTSNRVIKEIGINDYTKFEFEHPKAIVMNCAKGRVNARLRYYEKTAVEVHKSFLKYVNFEPKGDTLFIHTKAWPSSEKEMSRQINIYVPELAYLETELTSFTILDFNTSDLKIKCENAAFRLSQCKIERFDIDLSQRSNMYVDSYCTFDKVNARTDKSTILSFYGHVEKAFKLKSPDLDQLILGNVHPSIFKWEK